MMTASPSTDSLYGCSEASVMSDMSFAVGPSPSGDMMKASLGGACEMEGTERTPRLLKVCPRLTVERCVPLTL